MAMPTWINLARHVRRELENVVKRGPTPFEVAQKKVAEKERKQRELRERAAVATAEDV